MEKKKKIVIIGHFADRKDFYDGQTVSTRLLRDVLETSGKFRKICKVDAYNYRKNCVKVFATWLWYMFSCSYVIIMLSGNGLKVFSPLLYYAGRLLKKKVFHRVIGGELDVFLKQNPRYIKYMGTFEVNWVQSKKLVKKLENIGLFNAEYLENFRVITPVALQEVPQAVEKPFKFCTFCRVSEAKGIGLAIEAIAKVNAIMGAGTANIDIYGPIEEQYAAKFYALCKKHCAYVHYKGSVPSAQAVNILKDYYMHLFPTTWSGEGFPGTLIDCYNAALPTIASDWAYNAELIVEGETGYLYNWQKPEQLVNKIIQAIENESKLWSMKQKCLEEAGKYKSEVISAKIVTRIIGES